MLSILLIAISLAMDAFAVSVSSGLAVKGFNKNHALLMGAYFGMFQFIMPLIGWFLGNTVSSYVSRIGPYISFVLLAFIGINMIVESFKKNDDVVVTLTHKRLVLLATATSIDALAVGISFAFMDVNIILSAVIIGVVAFLFSVIGGMLGEKFSGVFSKRAETLGGIVLILIGIKIVVEAVI